MTTLKGTVYLCPMGCTEIENTTPSGIPDDKVSTVTELNKTGTAMVSLIPDKKYKIYSQHTIYFRKNGYLGCDTRLFWERDENTTVRLSYVLPVSCDWNMTVIEPAYPPNFSNTSGSPEWSITIENGTNRVIHTYIGETKNDVYTINDTYRLGDTIEYIFRSIFMIPGGYVQAKEVYSNGTRVLRTPFGTQNLIGGYIVAIATQDKDGADTDKGFLVNIFGHERIVEAADYNNYDIGNWVVLTANCCPRPKNNQNRVCPSFCHGEPEYIDEDGDGFYEIDTSNLYDSNQILAYDIKEDILRDDIDFMIVHIGIKDFGPIDTYYDYSGSSLDFSYMLDTCFHSGIVVAKHDDTKKIDIAIGDTLVEGVPIKYVKQGESSFADGYYAAYEDIDVIVAHITGDEDFDPDKMIAISVCRPSMPVGLFWLDEWNDMCFLWDFDTENYVENVTTNEGTLVSFPVLYNSITDWMSNHLIAVTTEDLGTYEYITTTPTVNPNGTSCPVFGYCNDQVISDINEGPSQNENGPSQATKINHVEITGEYIISPTDVTQYWGYCKTTGAYTGLVEKTLKLDLGEDYLLSAKINGNCYNTGEFENKITTGRKIQSNGTVEYNADYDISLTGVGTISGAGSYYNHGTYEKKFGKYKEIREMSVTNEEYVYLASGLVGGGDGNRLKLLIWGTFKSTGYKNTTSWYQKVPYVGIDTDTLVDESPLTQDYNNNETAYTIKLAMITELNKSYDKIDVIADGRNTDPLSAALYTLQQAADMRILDWREPAVLSDNITGYCGMATMLGKMSLPTVKFYDRTA